MSNNIAPGTHLQNLILNTTTSDQKKKKDCLKIIKVVLKNLSDPSKLNLEDPKYRQLRLSNPKVVEKLNFASNPSALFYLEAIGFSETTDGESGEKFLRLSEDSGSNRDASYFSACLLEVENALSIVTPSTPVDSSFSEEKKTQDMSDYTTAKPSSTISTKNLSEKQKARILLEKKRELEALEAKKARAKTQKLLKQDKHVRKHDSNWKSGVSAACAKSGSSISTFRDRHGEN